MTNRQKVIDFLIRHSEGIDDDELAKALDLKARQQANMICRKLESENLVSRRSIEGKIHNFWIGGEYVEQKVPMPIVDSKDKSKNWFWEGNVQDQVVQYLIDQDYKIVSAANTASREQGKDIVAEKDETTLWITVKGFPTGTPRTQPSTQAGHWFKQAVFDILQYRGESMENELGLAIPDFPRYRSLAEKISWMKPFTNFVYYWVKENGEVTVE